MFRSSTHTGYIAPRVFQDDTGVDRQAVQAVLSGIDTYPLAEYDGQPKRRDWRTLPTFPNPAGAHDGEAQWVFPETFFDQLPHVLADAPPLPGEQARYADVLALIDAIHNDPDLRAAVIDEAQRTEAELITPLLQFRNFGLPLPHHWTTITNGASFGIDYFTRTAVAKSNILANRAVETRYFYQDLDADGQRLNGANRYNVTFGPDDLPPVRGFWSLTLYNEHHFFAPNATNRYSVGTKNKDLRFNPNGSLTIYVQADEPEDADQRANWLPAPADADMSLFIRAYWPHPDIATRWTPPAVVHH